MAVLFFQSFEKTIFGSKLIIAINPRHIATEKGNWWQLELHEKTQKIGHGVYQTSTEAVLGRSTLMITVFNRTYHPTSYIPMEASQIPRKPFLDWVLENTKDCPRPEKTSSLCVRYMGGSKPKNAMNFRSQIKRAVTRKDKNSQLTPHQIVQLCFLLSIAVPEHRKDDLKEAGTLSLDKYDRIESFSAFDGSYEKKGTHSFYGLAKNPKRNKDVMITVQRLGEGPSRKVPVIAAPTITARRLSKQILNYSAVIETACLPLFKMQHQQVSSRPNQDITLENFSNKFQEALGALTLAATFYPTRTDRFVPFIECLKLLKFLLLNLDVPEEHPITKKVSDDIRIFTNGVAATFVPITSIDYMLTKLYEVIN